MSENLIDNQDEQEDELYEHHLFTVDKGQSLFRIDKYLGHKLEKTSRNRIQKAIEAKSILVNEKPVKPNYRVKPFDVIQIVFSHPPHDYTLVPENIPLDILYEDEALIVLNKPAGLVVHPGHGNYSGTLVNALLYHFENLPAPSVVRKMDPPRPGLVHRIDKDTSGIMVVAKTEVAMTALAKQFFDRTIERKYEALVWGNVKEDEGRIEGNIARDKRDKMAFAVYPNGDAGKHAATNYKVLQRFGFATKVECKLETGRTHQIRVHMKYIGHTLFNDDRYGGKQLLKGLNTGTFKKFIENCFELIPGQALHAKSLGFVHPFTEEKMYFEVEPPQGFLQIIEKWEKAAF